MPPISTEETPIPPARPQPTKFAALVPLKIPVFRNIQMSWTSGDKSELSPWMQIWRNARRWVG